MKTTLTLVLLAVLGVFIGGCSDNQSDDVNEACQNWTQDQ